MQSSLPVVFDRQASEEESLSLSLSRVPLIVPGKKKKWEAGQNICGQPKDIFVAPSFIERSKQEVTEGTVVHVSLLPLYTLSPRVHIHTYVRTYR